LGGLFTCCFFVPSVLGVVLGAVSLGPIRQGQARGQGLAVAGIVTGAIGILFGVVVWVVAARSPEVVPVPGRDVSAEDRDILVTIGAVEADEPIKLFYSHGMFSIREGGVVLTATRLMVYTEGGGIESANLEDIRAIRLQPGESWLDDGTFVVETDDGTVLVFKVAAQQGGDQTFDDVLRQAVLEARQAAGREPVSDQLSDEDDGD
jgi:hypothetical protein